eukprot:gene33064-40807_t
MFRKDIGLEVQQAAYDSLYLTLPEEVLTRHAAYSMTDSPAAACFAYLVAVVAGDSQAGTSGTFEPYSLAGLNGTGMVIGVSDTGVDENHCFFRDEVHGKVTRGSGKNIVT